MLFRAANHTVYSQGCKSNRETTRPATQMLKWGPAQGSYKSLPEGRKRRDRDRDRYRDRERERERERERDKGRQGEHTNDNREEDRRSTRKEEKRREEKEGFVSPL